MSKMIWSTGREIMVKQTLKNVMSGVRLIVFGLFAASLSAVSFAVQAQNAIQSVSGSVQGGSEVIRIDLAEPLLALPNGFSIQAPARIALDFPGVVNSIGRSSVDLSLGNLRSANVVQAGERTRVVLNLRTATVYKAEIQGKSLLITLEPASVAAPSVFGTVSTRALVRQ